MNALGKFGEEARVAVSALYLLSCSPNFPRALIRYKHAKLEPILKLKRISELFLVFRAPS